MVEYRGYLASIAPDPATGTYLGTIENVPDHVTFRVESLATLADDMARAVEQYIEMCLEWGRNPTVEYSTDLEVRISADVERVMTTEV